MENNGENGEIGGQRLRGRSHHVLVGFLCKYSVEASMTTLGMS
jgi:hypothetical protein